jgi:hypothetical protein
VAAFVVAPLGARDSTSALDFLLGSACFRFLARRAGKLDREYTPINANENIRVHSRLLAAKKA